MDIFFHDPNDIPLPPEEVHIRDFRAQPYPDGRRIRVYLELSPFQQRPSGEITITNEVGQIVATTNFIETVDPKMDMTIHLRDYKDGGEFTILAEIYYQEKLEDNQEGTIPSFELQERKIVYQSSITFEI